MMTTTKSRGKRRMLELAAEAEIERSKIEADLLAGLGHPASALDRAAIESLSASIVRARRLRSYGRDDHAERKFILQQMRGLGLKPAAPSAPPAESMDEYLRRTAAQAASSGAAGAAMDAGDAQHRSADSGPSGLANAGATP